MYQLKTKWVAMAAALFAGCAVSASAASTTTPVTLTDATAVTALSDFSQETNSAVYIIQAQERGGFYTQTDVSPVQIACCGNSDAFANSPLDWNKDIAVSADDVNQQFAIITWQDKKYLYSVAAKGFVSYSGGKAIVNTTSASDAELTLSVSNVANLFRITIKGYIMNHSGGYDKNTYKGIYLAGSADQDGGNRYNIQRLNNVTLPDAELEAALTVIEGELAKAKREKTALLTDIKEFYHNQHEIDSYITQISTASSVSQINQIVESVMTSLNGKLVYLVYAPRRNEADYKYLGVLGNDRLAQLLPERGTRAKWQLDRVGSTYRFQLRNIASDTRIANADNGGHTVADASAKFEVEFKNNTSETGSVSLKYYNDNRCLTVNDQFVLAQSENSEGQVNEAANAWRIEPVGIDPNDIVSGSYYVIRSNRALTASPSGYEDGYPGTLLGVYTADRAKARRSQSISDGVHLRQYSTGMHTIWKIVRDGDNGGFKLYSLLGEGGGENSADLGMTFNGSDIVTLSANPSTIYIRSVAQWDYNNILKSPIPNGVALCSSSSETSGNNCFEQSNSLGESSVLAEFFVKSNTSAPNAVNGLTNHGAIFYIERVSNYDVEQAKKSYVDYAKNKRSFELLKAVLDEEDEAYALSMKTLKASDVSDIPSANAYLNDGDKVSSTLAFERLDGKLVRFHNREHATSFMSINGNSLNATANNADADMSHIWRIELVNAPLRQIRLVNYSNNKYIGQLPAGDNTAYALVDDEANAGVFTVQRYYSLDGTEFYMNLLTNGHVSHNAMHLAPQLSNAVVRWTHAGLASQWTMVAAVNEASVVDKTDVQIIMNKEVKSISVRGPEGTSLVKNPNLGEHHKVTLTPIPAENGISMFAEPLVIPNDKVVADGDNNGFTIDTTTISNFPDVEGNYKLTFPVGYFTIDNKLTPEMAGNVVLDSGWLGIEDVTEAAGNAGETVVYDLQGRRVAGAAAPGVYIINGRKVLVK